MATMTEPTASFQREPARRILLRHLHQGRINIEEGTPRLLLPSLEKVSRISVVANVLAKEKKGNITNVLVDDGTGQTVARFFEAAPLLEYISIGETILIVGKPRIYNQEIYLSPEIIKRVSSFWLRVRQAELNRGPWVAALPDTGEESSPEEKIKMEEVLLESAGKEDLPLTGKVLCLIKEMDGGGGVLVEELIEKSPVKGVEQALEKMMESGEIFQNAPGKVKAL